MKLYNIAENLILETASRNNIMKCISDRRIAEVYYDDEQDPGGEGPRQRKGGRRREGRGSRAQAPLQICGAARRQAQTDRLGSRGERQDRSHQRFRAAEHGRRRGRRRNDANPELLSDLTTLNKISGPQ